MSNFVVSTGSHPGYGVVLETNMWRRRCTLASAWVSYSAVTQPDYGIVDREAYRQQTALRVPHRSPDRSAGAVKIHSKLAEITIIELDIPVLPPPLLRALLHDAAICPSLQVRLVPVFSEMERRTRSVVNSEQEYPCREIVEPRKRRLLTEVAAFRVVLCNLPRLRAERGEGTLRVSTAASPRSCPDRFRQNPHSRRRRPANIEGGHGRSIAPALSSSHAGDL